MADSTHARATIEPGYGRTEVSPVKSEDGATADSSVVSAIWSLLEHVPDPEIPVLSVVDLGIVRDVTCAPGEAPRVSITPTYSGCPATAVIRRDIEHALHSGGYPAARVVEVLSPPWTSDWLTDAGRRKLREFGIAPPEGTHAMTKPMPIDVAGISPLRRAAVAIGCPRCASTRTELVSQFGSTACKAHYRCRDCLEPFDYFKPH